MQRHRPRNWAVCVCVCVCVCARARACVLALATNDLPIQSHTLLPLTCLFIIGQLLGNVVITGFVRSCYTWLVYLICKETPDVFPKVSVPSHISIYNAWAWIFLTPFLVFGFADIYYLFKCVYVCVCVCVYCTWLCMYEEAKAKVARFSIPPWVNDLR